MSSGRLIGCHLHLLSFLVFPTGFYWVLLGLTGFLTSLQGSKGFFCVLLGSLVNFFRFVVIYGVLLGMTWLFVFL